MDHPSGTHPASDVITGAAPENANRHVTSFKLSLHGVNATHTVKEVQAR